MNPNANPFRIEKPIDIAMKEIKSLKILVRELSEELKEIHNDLRPLQNDLGKRIKIDQIKDSDCVIENSSWWWS
tara:strand:+ start:1435 stop:1656 length:222 start_codon:yes stop_codon:yes gene_type:complete